MSSAFPDEPSDKDLLLSALRGFLDQYDDNRATWPDDMVRLLDQGHYALAASIPAPRRDYGTHTYEPGYDG